MTGGTPRRERLGRGLGALLGEYLEAKPEGSEPVRSLPLDAIVPNPLQPRREFNPDELLELARSISAGGLLQPIVVRPDPGTQGRYQIVAGERRYRAVTSLGWSEVPVVFRELDDEMLLVLAMVENIQRSDLGPIEEAEGYERLGRSFGLSPAEIGVAVGKDRSTVANSLRLLRLPPEARSILQRGAISAGHARALLSLDDEQAIEALARQAAAEQWSVRETERRVRARIQEEPGSVRPSGGTRSAPVASGQDPALALLEEELAAHMGTRVKIHGDPAGPGGRIEIPWKGIRELERLVSIVLRREVSELLGPD